MTLIAKQPYIKMVRQVSSLEQVDIEDQRTMYLYEEELTTKHRTFSTEDVHDISYRFIGDGGFLYVHTSKGVFSYIVKDSPADFVEAYKAHFKK